MDINTIIISLIYYIGIASCAAQGAENGKYEKKFRCYIILQTHLEAGLYAMLS